MKKFFEEVRKAFGPLSVKQVEGIELLVNTSAALPLKHRAYVLGTAWHETARTMQPIEEYGKGKGKKYGEKDPTTGQVYYGRGFVQLTWKDNYAKAQNRLQELNLINDNVNFVVNPDLVMQPKISAYIICIGMKEGWFTGKKMGDYNNYIDMRRVVNGTDRAKDIAKYAEDFEHALSYIDEPVIDVKPLPPVIADIPEVEVKPELPKNVSSGIAAWIVGLLLAAFAALGAWMTQGGN